jgi:hypothetical protein
LSSISRNDVIRPSSVCRLIGADGSEAGSNCPFWTLDHAKAEKGFRPFASRTGKTSLLPQLVSYPDRIDFVALPPCDLITLSVERSMMGSAKWDCVFVTDTATKGASLREAQVMRIRRPPPADQARLRRHEPEVGAVAVAAWFAHREGAFVDVPSHGIVDPFRQPAFCKRRQAQSRITCLHQYRP